MGRLTIQEIAKVLITKNGLEQSEANRFATELFAVIQERLEKNDLVKVKGLGTFKVITVEARESVSVRTGSRVMIDEHSKITFTPDATMKELVNKPFSQFETVPLNDNVEFDDLKEQDDDAEFEDIKNDLTEEELIQLEQMDKSEEPVAKIAEPVVEEPKEEPKEEPVVEEPKEEPKEEPVTEEPKEEPQDDVEETSELVDFYDEEEESSPLSKWLWLGFAAICIACLSAFGGYYYGCQHTALLALGDTVVVRDTIYMAAPQDTTSTETPVQVDKQEVAKIEEPKQEAPKAETPKVEKAKVENVDEERIKFVEEEVLFPLRQKIMDMQQMQAVNMQGIIAMEIVRRNNKELIRAVERAESVTVSALRIAVTVASALYNQKIVLDKVKAVNEATNRLIGATAKMLKEQGAEIQKQAMETNISVDTLKSAFADTFDALDAVTEYKHKALPQMQLTIQQFRELSDEGEKRIKKMEAREEELKRFENGE